MGIDRRPATAIATAPPTTAAAWKGSDGAGATFDGRAGAVMAGALSTKARPASRGGRSRQPHHHPRAHALAPQAGALAGAGRPHLDVAGVEEAGLDQERAGRAVVGEVAGPDDLAAPVVLRPAERAGHRLCAIAAVPERAAQPHAQLRAPRRLLAEPQHADRAELAVLDDEADPLVAARGLGQARLG